MAELGQGRQIGVALVSGPGDQLVTCPLPLHGRDPLRNPDQRVEPEESTDERLDAGDEIVVARDLRALVAELRLELALGEVVAAAGGKDDERAEDAQHRRR